VRAQFAAANVDFEFLDAVDGATLAPELRRIDGHQYRLNTRREPLPGEIGCYLSHFAAWQRCVDLGEPLVVMEDDLRLEGTFAAGLRALERLPREFGYVRLEPVQRARALGKRLRGATRRLCTVEAFGLDYVSDVPLCMLAYVIRPHAAAALVAAGRTITAPVDNFIQRTWDHGQPIFALHPAIVGRRPDSDYSSIGDRTRKSFSPRLLLARAAYKAKGEFRRFSFDRRQLRVFERRTHSTQPAEQL
jgi:glycosyl transferase family 25